ncbi:MAG: protein kinase [Acidobacteria bacterium]|nr:protein kinase [Acidobacteriota bacterium]
MAPRDSLEADVAAPPPWTRVKALFLDVVDLPEPDRVAFLDRECAGDAAVRREVDSLLENDRDALAFCETPAAAILSGIDADSFGRRYQPGSRFGAYEITGFIGAGGMGEVYRARDTRDGREVALKTVVAALAHPVGELRLVREARHAAMLAHPNICSILEVGDAEGVPFIAMELLGGRTLSATQRDGPVPVTATLRYAIDVASALEHAHERGLVHRDLKASNILINGDDRAIVLDFGLAKRLPGLGADESSLDSLTAAHQGPPGTLSHMAPEVLRGGAADARADIWALGVVLFQLVTGELPFKGRTPFETSSAILEQQPGPMPRCVPMLLRLVVGRCLAKEPDLRYQHAGELRNALTAVHAHGGWPGATRLILTSRASRPWLLASLALVCALAVLTAWVLRAPATPIRTLAVLPLAHGPSSDDEVYADGMTDALIAQLGAAANLHVFSRGSVVHVGAGRSGPAAGRELGADAVVEGTLDRSPEQLTLELRVVDTVSGRVRWTQAFSRPPREVLALQADAVRALAGRIQATMRPEGARQLALVPSVQPEVYEAYLKGRYEWNQRTAGSLTRAIAHFERAILLDPAYAPAHAGLADSYNQLGTVMVGSGSPREYRPRAEAAAIKALQIDSNSAEAHAALGYVRHYTWQWTDSEKAFLRAIQLNPAQALPRLWYANLLMSRGRFDEALTQAQVARDIDPFSLIVQTNIGWIHFFARRNNDAIEALTRAVALDGEYPQARWRLADALSGAGRHDEALVQANEAVRLTQRSSSSMALLAHVHARAGHLDQARQILGRVVARSQREYVSPGIIPGVYVELGDREAAYAWMDSACEEQANAAAYFAVVPWADPLRGDPRFEALLRRIGLAERVATAGRLHR